MKMEIITVQHQYQSQYDAFVSSKIKDWTSTIMPPTKIQTAAKLPYLQRNTTNKMKNNINKKSNRTVEMTNKSRSLNAFNTSGNSGAAILKKPNLYCNLPQANLLNCDQIDSTAAMELSARLLDELRAAKTRHLSCTEVSIPCDLTLRIANEIIKVSEKEPCGIRGCTIYIEFEDEPNNSRRIATLKLDPETVSTFEVYLALRQDHRGWTALLPQFMKNLARTITISPEFTITKHKLYSPSEVSYSCYNNGVSQAIATPIS